MMTANIQLKLEIEGFTTPGTLLDNPAKVCYFTGLPLITVLKALFEFVSACVSTPRSALSPFQQFVLVLMKLRLNVDNELLSTYFMCMHLLFRVTSRNG